MNMTTLHDHKCRSLTTNANVFMFFKIFKRKGLVNMNLKMETGLQNRPE